MINETAKKVLHYIETSPTAFHTVENLAQELKESGFMELKETERWTLNPGGRYYVMRNHSSILSFVLPLEKPSSFRLIASHSDSPSFKLKPDPEISGNGNSIKLNIEGYGGMIHSSWFDRPLSIAGRIIVFHQGEMEEKLVNLDRDLVLIPSLAVHMEPKTNKGIAFNLQNDLLPVFAQNHSDPNLTPEMPTIADLIAEQAEVMSSQIIGSDLFLYNRMPPVFWGADNEFIASARLDDLECCYTTFLGFLEAADATHQKSAVNIHVVFDNEEVGSGTAQGADSTFLSHVMERISLACACSREEYLAQEASSVMLSADNAHALHPNHPDKADPVNRPVMNKGIVIKHNANQKYTTDAYSQAMVIRLCQENKIPYQFYTNRSDMPGGSTLGNIAQAHVSMKTADIGLAQLAMHSSYESAGARDPEYMKQLAKAFYSKEEL